MTEMALCFVTPGFAFFLAEVPVCGNTVCFCFVCDTGFKTEVVNNLFYQLFASFLFITIIVCHKQSFYYEYAHCKRFNRLV